MGQSSSLIVSAMSSLDTSRSGCQYNCSGFFAVKAVFAAKVVSFLTTFFLYFLPWLMVCLACPSLGCSECATVTFSQGFMLTLCRVCLGFPLYYTLPFGFCSVSFFSYIVDTNILLLILVSCSFLFD